ncbi:MAG: multiheme c-type cytochrome, partial [Deferrisomatales bacterium]
MVVDGGNLLFYRGRLREIEADQLLHKARVIVEAYNEIGVAGVALGPYDFAAGYDRLRELEGLARFPLLCANLLDRRTGEPVFRPYRVVEAGGVKVGLLGVLDSAAPIEGLEGADAGFRVEPTYSAVKRYARELKELGCELVVVLSAMDPKKFRLMAKNVDEVDLFVAGDPDDKLQIPWKIGTAMVANASHLGKYLGHVTAVVPAPGQGRASLTHGFVAMKPDYWDDPGVRRMVDGYYKHVAVTRARDPQHYVKEDEEEVNLRLGRAIYASARECASCHPEAYRRWQETRHAKALAVLPEKDRQRVECLECHV